MDVRWEIILDSRSCRAKNSSTKRDVTMSNGQIFMKEAFQTKLFSYVSN